MRLFKSVFQTSLLVVGAAGIYKYSISRQALPLGLGLFCFGLLLVIPGRDLWVYRRMLVNQMLDSRPGYFIGLVPQLWGANLLFVGFLLMSFGACYGFVPGAPAVLELIFMETRLGLWAGLSLLGLILTFFGVVGMLEEAAIPNSGIPKDAHLSTGRSGGVIPFLFGMGVIGFALWGILLVEVFDRVVRGLLALF